MEDKEATIALLEWYRAMGVDETAGYDSQPWFIQPDRAVTSPPIPRLEPSGTPDTQATLLKPSVDTPRDGGKSYGSAGWELAQNAHDIPSLRVALETFDGCKLRNTAKRLCLYRGAVDGGGLMIIGDAPNKEDEASAEPFSGLSGRLLDLMLASIDLDSSRVYMTNLVFWKPPGNNAASGEDIEACLPFLIRQIELVRPSLIVSLGDKAMQVLTGSADRITKRLGQLFPLTLAVANAPVPAVIPLFHTDYLMRNPAEKHRVWPVLLAIQDILQDKADRSLRD